MHELTVKHISHLKHLKTERLVKQSDCAIECAGFCGVEFGKQLCNEIKDKKEEEGRLVYQPIS